MTIKTGRDYYRPDQRVYLFPAAGPGGRNPFTQGTFWDLEAEGIEPAPGMRLSFYSDDADDKGERDYLLFTGVIGYEQHGDYWYAVIDEGSFCHESDLQS